MKKSLNSLIVMLLCAALFSGCDKDDLSEEIIDYESFYATGRSDGYEYIDIGLSVPWATYNYGAYSPSQFGDYTLPIYWGKSTKIPSQISGSDWDRIRHLMGKNWRLPTENEVMELRNQCSWNRCRFNGIEGVKVTGPNGKSIFFPITGWNYFDEIPWSNIDGPYLQYSKDFWGFLESDGKFDLLIPYENTYLRYAMNNDGELYFQINTNVNSISPLRAVYSSSNPSGNSSSGNGGNSSGYEIPEIGLEDYTCTTSSITVKYRIYNQSEAQVSSAKGYYGTSSPTQSVSATVSGSLITIRFTSLNKGTTYYIKCTATGKGGSTTSDTVKLMTNY